MEQHADNLGQGKRSVLFAIMRSTLGEGMDFTPVSAFAGALLLLHVLDLNGCADLSLVLLLAHCLLCVGVLP